MLFDVCSCHLSLALCDANHSRCRWIHKHTHTRTQAQSHTRAVAHVSETNTFESLYVIRCRVRDDAALAEWETVCVFVRISHELWLRWWTCKSLNQTTILWNKKTLDIFRREIIEFDFVFIRFNASSGPTIQMFLYKFYVIQFYAIIRRNNFNYFDAIFWAWIDWVLGKYLYNSFHRNTIRCTKTYK